MKWVEIKTARLLHFKIEHYDAHPADRDSSTTAKGTGQIVKGILGEKGTNPSKRDDVLL
jgi:hypothetical protein